MDTGWRPHQPVADDDYEWARWGSLASWLNDHPADPVGALALETATVQRSHHPAYAADSSVLGGNVEGGPVKAGDVDQDHHASVGQRLVTCGCLVGRVHYLRLALRHGERPDVGTTDVQ